MATPRTRTAGHRRFDASHCRHRGRQSVCRRISARRPCPGIGAQRPRRHTSSHRPVVGRQRLAAKDPVAGADARMPGMRKTPANSSNFSVRERAKTKRPRMRHPRAFAHPRKIGVADLPWAERSAGGGQQFLAIAARWAIGRREQALAAAGGPQVEGVRDVRVLAHGKSWDVACRGCDEGRGRYARKMHRATRFRNAMHFPDERLRAIGAHCAHAESLRQAQSSFGSDCFSAA